MMSSDSTNLCGVCENKYLLLKNIFKKSTRFALQVRARTKTRVRTPTVNINISDYNSDPNLNYCCCARSLSCPMKTQSVMPASAVGAHAGLER